MTIGPDGELLSDNTFALPDGQILQYVHRPNQCTGEFCVIHRPSDHQMRQFPLRWRNDIKLMERICPHGVGHPDPDHMAWEGGTRPHACDGCCTSKPHRRHIRITQSAILEIPYNFRITKDGELYTGQNTALYPIMGVLDDLTDVISASQADLDKLGIQIVQYEDCHLEWVP